ncbi:hypothetical protein P5V15_015764 [Pogonomyrmex californicus]
MESNVIDTSRLTREHLDCKILRMESPHLFWIRLKTGESSLKELMEELGFRMNRKSSTLICWPYLMKINLAVAIKEGDIWHRGIVMAVGRIQGIARVALRDEGREVAIQRIIHPRRSLSRIAVASSHVWISLHWPDSANSSMV